MFGENPPLREAIEFYKHKHNWSNRLIAGDSLLVMNSLLEKEGLGGQVQMVYLDPPYGIKYGSNFQPFVNKRDVKDGSDDDLTSEPETIRAFRDTWELGIHSYLTYLRDRLLLARELLTESGSIFVQISDENVHLVRNLMDEVFGADNFVAIIAFKKKKMPLGETYLFTMCDYIVWYAKDKTKLKFRRLFVSREYGEGSDFNYTEIPNIGENNSIQKDAKFFQSMDMRSSGRTESCVFEYEFSGKKFFPSGGKSWKTNLEGMKRLEKLNRLFAPGNTLRYKLFYDDYPVAELSHMWMDTQGATDMKYVVQTTEKAIQRCMLMTTDPGDLVFDPTCGSGTTAYVAEQWGRRWITCDTSRVAVTLAKQRLMTALFDYYQLAHPAEGVGSGFKYKTVPHITLGSIANNEPPGQETLYDQPKVDNSKARVTGPFTVEAVPAPAVIPLHDLGNPPHPDPLPEGEGVTADASIGRSGESLRQAEWRDELLKTGIRGKGGQNIIFSRVETLSGTHWLHADAETTKEVFSGQFSVSSNTENSKLKTENLTERVVISFGPEHAPLEQRQVEMAWEEARTLSPKPAIIVFATFQFDPEAAKDIDELTKDKTGMTFLKVQMNADLLTEDLKKKRSSNESFWLIGQPDARVLSFEFLVFSDDRRLGEYETFKKLSGLNSLAEINELSEQDIQYYAILSQGRDLWHYLSDEKGWDFNTVKYCRRTSQEQQRGIQPVSWNCTRLISGIGNFDTDLSEFGIHSLQECRRIVEQLRRDSKIIGSLKEIANELKLSVTKNSKLTTKNFSQVEVHGFDYYNTKTGMIESGDTGKIAIWMLDTDYDGRSLYPHQVFFPMSGEKDGWTRLAKNLKAEVDETLIEAYRGTVSLPFALGEHKRVAVKIVDDRGIESLKIMRVDVKN